MNYLEMSKDLLLEEKVKVEAEYVGLKKKALSLDLSRGKPGKEQVDMMTDMLTCLADPKDCISENGTDCRNYGILDGIPEAKKLFADLLGIPAKNIFVAKNLTLTMKGKKKSIDKESVIKEIQRLL